MSNITNKNQATSYLNANITNDVGTEPFLNPTPTYAIKSGNLKYYLNRFIEWIFPGTPTDVRGKVLGIPHSNTPNTDYSGLSWLTMMPLGGITMYAVNGRNKDIGGGVFVPIYSSPDINNFNTELDGFLFCDGSIINVNTAGNEKYKELQKLLQGYYENTTDGDLKLPNMSGRVPLGYHYGDPITPVNTSVNNINYGKTGNIGGEQGHILAILEMPIHTHGSDDGNQNGNLIAITYGRNEGGPADGGTPSLDPGVGRILNIPIVGKTSPEGGNQPHENRQPYMVLSYIIKY
jgi:microcystin-dependent protein